ncbi:MAG: hypothetical protein IT452_19310, partial [Planctomycetia bacterium]|nr:hypothetical protein [Planctomycetia bacterium]
VTASDPIPAGILTITIASTGQIYREGALTTIADLPEARNDLQRGVIRQPILLAADSTLSMRSVIPLFRELVEQGKCSDISFAVERSGQRSRVPICIPIAYSPPGLRFMDGPREINELGSYKTQFGAEGGFNRSIFIEKSHIWIELRTEPLRVESVTIGGWESCRPLIWTHTIDGRRPGGKFWSGDWPEKGSLTLETLQDFVRRPEVAHEAPVLLLFALPEDSVDTCVRRAAELRSIGPQVMFMLREK